MTTRVARQVTTDLKQLPEAFKVAVVETNARAINFPYR